MDSNEAIDSRRQDAHAEPGGLSSGVQLRSGSTTQDLVHAGDGPMNEALDRIVADHATSSLAWDGYAFHGWSGRPGMDMVAIYAFAADEQHSAAFRAYRDGSTEVTTLTPGARRPLSDAELGEQLGISTEAATHCRTVIHPALTAALGAYNQADEDRSAARDATRLAALNHTPATLTATTTPTTRPRPVAPGRAPGLER